MVGGGCLRVYVAKHGSLVLTVGRLLADALFAVLADILACRSRRNAAQDVGVVSLLRASDGRSRGVEGDGVSYRCDTYHGQWVSVRREAERCCRDTRRTGSQQTGAQRQLSHCTHHAYVWTQV